MFWALLVLLSLITFDGNDPSLNHVVSGNVVVSNKAGLFGAYLAGFLNDVFGVAAYIWPLVFGALGAAYVSTLYELLWWRWCGYFLLTLCCLSAGSAWDFSLGDVHSGGMVGNALYRNSTRLLSPAGSSLLWAFVVIMGTQLAFGLSWLQILKRFGAYLGSHLNFDTIPRPHIPHLALPKWRMPSLEELRGKLAEPPTSTEALPQVYVDVEPVRQNKDDDVFASVQGMPPSSHASQPGTVPMAETRQEDVLPVTEDVTLVEQGEADLGTSTALDAKGQSGARAHHGQGTFSQQPSTAPAAGSTSQGPGRLEKVWRNLAGQKAKVPMPSLDLLKPRQVVVRNAKDETEAKGKALITCLANFDVKGDLVRVTPGPVVTMYEVRPAAGVRVNRICNLSDDLALALKAMAVRIQAPIPGSDTVGIEIPNVQRAMVNFREMLESPAFKKDPGPLTMALGKDIAGTPFVAELSRMPHLLVAGATGMGKSVGLNSILLSLLYTVGPDDVQFLLIDPKRIELAVYADLPHLVHPVVTEMQQAKTALDWAVHEMDQRYAAMARLGVRNIAGYNQKLESYGKNLPQDLSDLERMPYLIIIIDELADLMMTAAREVETSIVRLAQLARASGIHMILATQRPSVDVVTGLIKANFPCRISFQVTSKHDSRTILDTVGAEHLLGKGDMLFKPSGGRLMRLHGPFVDDDEVKAVVAYWKRQLPPRYQVDFSDWGMESATANGIMGGGDASQDSLYGEVRDFVDEQGKASISLVQRRFKIGFNRAARLVEQLERDGIIGPADGSKPRNVVR